MQRRTDLPEVARGLAIPYWLDSVGSPEVTYRYAEPSALYHNTEDGAYVRITFENLDALKVSRGEHLPYPEDDTNADSENAEDSHTQVFIVDNSRWLRERYEYEAKHYGNSYQWGGDVSEMLTDFDHYLFAFHDQFVEATAKGIWIECSEKPFSATDWADLDETYPLKALPPSATVERIKASGLICQVRSNPKPLSQIIADSRLCSQPLLHFALELEGGASVNHYLALRTRRGVTKSIFSGYFGNAKAEFEGVAALTQVRPLIESYMTEVSARRRAMGKL